MSGLAARGPQSASRPTVRGPEERVSTPQRRKEEGVALFRRRHPADQTVRERPVVVERRGPGVMTAITSAIGWIVLLVVLAIVVLVLLL
jgi:hypothetical protein